MQTPNNQAGRLTENIMAALRRVGTLKPDEPNHPTHYNATYSAVYEALARELEPPASKVSTVASPPVDTIGTSGAAALRALDRQAKHSGVR